MAKKTAAKKSSKKSAKKASAKKTSKKVTSVSAKTVRSEADKSEKKSVKETKTSTRKKAARKSSKAAPTPAPTGIKKSLKLAPGVMISGIKKHPQPACSHKDDAPQTFRKLKKKEMEDIRQKLIEMREIIIEGIRKEYADSRSRSGSAPADIVDQASDAYDDDISSEIAATNDEELEQIEAALERLKEGSYGLCEMCSDPISPSRLKILPFATRCVSCRGDYEKVKKRRNGGSVNFFGDGEFDPDAE